MSVIMEDQKEAINTIDLPWIEKYRPKNLDDIISHKEIISAIRTFIKNKCLPHLLLYGPPGTGKSSLVTAAARQLYGKYYPFMVMELNASDDRGIGVVRGQIKQFVMSENVFFGKNVKDRKNIFKLVILDETDAMTGDAQAILRKVIEKYTYNTRFCLICNYIQNINIALQSRCTKFRFQPLSQLDIEEKIKYVAKIENINITNPGIKTIIKRSIGDMRKVLNIMQATSMAYNILNDNNINMLIGYPTKHQIEQIIEIIMTNKLEESYFKIKQILHETGLSLNDIITEFHDIFVGYIIDGTTTYKYFNKFSNDKILIILNKLRIIEFNQSINVMTNVQLGALIGVFTIN